MSSRQCVVRSCAHSDRDGPQGRCVTTMARPSSRRMEAGGWSSPRSSRGSPARATGFRPAGSQAGPHWKQPSAALGRRMRSFVGEGYVQSRSNRTRRRKRAAPSGETAGLAPTTGLGFSGLSRRFDRIPETSDPRRRVRHEQSNRDNSDRGRAGHLSVRSLGRSGPPEEEERECNGRGHRPAHPRRKRSTFFGKPGV